MWLQEIALQGTKEAVILMRRELNTLADVAMANILVDV